MAKKKLAVIGASVALLAAGGAGVMAATSGNEPNPIPTPEPIPASAVRAPTPAPKYPPDINVSAATFLVQRSNLEVFVAPGTGVEAGNSCFVVVDSDGSAAACGDPATLEAKGTQYGFVRPDGQRETWAYVPAGYTSASYGAGSAQVDNRVAHLVTPPGVREITVTGPNVEPLAIDVPGT